MIPFPRLNIKFIYKHKIHLASGNKKWYIWTIKLVRTRSTGRGKQKGGAKATRNEDPALGRGGAQRRLDRAGAQHHPLQRTELPVAELDLPPGSRPARPALGAPGRPGRGRRRHLAQDRRSRLRGFRPRVAWPHARLS